jgi:uracil-DNA glycosylase family 4
MVLLRGTLEGAKCHECPFANQEGRAHKPVFSEFPEKPAWILVGEGPGNTEVNLKRCFVGLSGEVVNKVLTKVGCERSTIFVGNATLCQPPQGSPDVLRDRAAKACAPRLQRELAQFPGVPVLTLGAVAARALIPQATLDAIDPPNIPKSKKRAQKERQKAEAKAIAKDTRLRVKTIDKMIKRRFKELINERHKQLLANMPSAPGKMRSKATRALLDRLIEENRELPKLEEKARKDAIDAWHLGAKERALQAAHEAANPKPNKPPKPKKIKITDIMGSCFHVDVDGSGPRYLIPAIHPAALLRGGGATIGGTHTPDLAFINLIYDAGKVNALGQGKNIHLQLNIETELEDSQRTGEMLRDIVYEAIAEGECAIDLETFVEDPERHHALMAYMAGIKALGIATKQRSISLLWALVPSWAHSYLQLLLVHPKVRCCYHNGLYDRSVLTANGFTLEGEWNDTLLLHHAAFPGCAHNLQSVVSQFFATEPWKSSYRNNDETTEKLLTYCAKDTGGTLAVRPKLEIIIKQTKTEKIYELDKKMAEIASKMHLAGMPVDRDVNQELLTTFSKNVKDSRKAVESIAADPKIAENLRHHLAIMQAQTRRKKDEADFELRYNQRMAEIKIKEEIGKWKWKIGAPKHIAALIQALGHQLVQVTESGQISTKKDILEALAAKVPVVRDILSYRENDKLLSTFIYQVFDRYDSSGELIQYGYADDNDRVHPIWTVHKITGRWASSEPVVSNVPKEKYKKLADGSKALVRPNLRKQIVAPKGRIFVGFDFCLAKGTLIDTPHGHRPIEDLKPGDFVFSYNHTTHRPDCAKVIARASTGRRSTLKVVLDNDEVVRCTPDHRWLVRPWGGGEAGVIEVKAEDLRPGMRLLPLRRAKAGDAKHGNEYETLYSYSAFKYVKTHIVVAAAAHGPRPDGMHVHHKDEDRFNNSPNNLEYKLIGEHLSEHSTEGAREQWKDPGVRAKMRAGISRSIAARGGYHGENNPNYGNRSGEEVVCPNCGESTYTTKGQHKKFCSAKCYNAFRVKNPVKRGTKYSDLNHKVVAVINDGLIVETFDIEVERDHNFALAAGVFVHNCQLEYRVIALISGDEFLCRVFAEGKDIHRECARLIFSGFDQLEPTLQKKARDEGKNFSYGALYGGSAETLHETLCKQGHSYKLADVAKSHALLLAGMPGVVAWQRGCVQTASRPPYEIREFLYGRRRTFPMGQVEATESMNFGVQAAGASIMNTGMARMDQALDSYKEAFAVCQIHDSAIFECWEEDSEKLMDDVKRCFTQEYSRDGRVIPFPIEAAIAKSWDKV